MSELTKSLSYTVSNMLAYAALNSSGHVLTWGKASSGGDSSSAFAGVTSSGEVITFGATSSGGQLNSNEYA
eukprot:gene46139-57531_t